MSNPESAIPAAAQAPAVPAINAATGTLSEPDGPTNPGAVRFVSGGHERHTADQMRAVASAMLAAAPQPAATSPAVPAGCVLTQAAIDSIMHGCWDGPGLGARFDRDKFARAIEAAVLAAAPQPAEAQAPAVPASLTDEQIDRIADNVVKAMPEGVRGFLNTWGWRQFARELLDVCAGHVRAQPEVWGKEQQ